MMCMCRYIKNHVVDVNDIFYERLQIYCMTIILIQPSPLPSPVPPSPHKERKIRKEASTYIKVSTYNEIIGV